MNDTQKVAKVISSLISTLANYEIKIENERKVFANEESFYPDMAFKYLQTFHKLKEEQIGKLNRSIDLSLLVDPSPNNQPQTRGISHNKYLKLSEIIEFVEFQIGRKLDISSLEAMIKNSSNYGECDWKNKQIDLDCFNDLILPKSNPAMKAKVLKRKLIYENQGKPVLKRKLQNSIAQIFAFEIEAFKELEIMRKALAREYEWDPLELFQICDQENKGFLSYEDVSKIMQEHGINFNQIHFDSLIRRIKKKNFFSERSIKFEEMRYLITPKTPFSSDINRTMAGDISMLHNSSMNLGDNNTLNQSFDRYSVEKLPSPKKSNISYSKTIKSDSKDNKQNKKVRIANIVDKSKQVNLNETKFHLHNTTYASNDKNSNDQNENTNFEGELIKPQSNFNNKIESFGVNPSGERIFQESTLLSNLGNTINRNGLSKSGFIPLVTSNLDINLDQNKTFNNSVRPVFNVNDRSNINILGTQSFSKPQNAEISAQEFFNQTKPIVKNTQSQYLLPPGQISIFQSNIQNKSFGKNNTAPFNFTKDKTILIPNYSNNQSIAIQNQSIKNYSNNQNNISNINLDLPRAETVSFGNNHPIIQNQASATKRKRRKIFEEYRPADQILYDVLQGT